jgi:hypothetical protein
VALGLAALAASPLSRNDEDENYRQLQAMPRERRAALLEDLERFDKLPQDEQAKIRKLNDVIAGKDPVDQLRYRSLMRRYQLWVHGLSKEDQEALRTTDDADARFNLAVKFRKAELQSGSAQRIFGIRTGYYGLEAPYEAAQLLRIWHTMDKAERYQLENRQGKTQFANEIREYGRQHHTPSHPFPAAEDKKYDEILNTDEFRAQLRNFADRTEIPSKKDEAAKGKAEQPRTRFRLHFAEFLYFEDHKPKPVSQQNLEKFSNFCPNWFHTMIDPLSADDARNYLTIIYRLIFTDTGEITADWKPAREKATTVPGSARPTPKKEKAGSPGPL